MSLDMTEKEIKVRAPQFEKDIVEAAAKVDKRSLSSFLMYYGLKRAYELGIIDKAEEEE